MNLKKLILFLAIIVAVPFALSSKVNACSTSNPGNVSCNDSYYHASPSIKVVLHETSDVKMWLPNNQFPVVITVSEPGKTAVTYWWDQRTNAVSAWDTRTVTVSAGSTKEITYSVKVCYGGDKSNCDDVYGWMPSNLGNQRYNCGTGCQCAGYPANTYYGQNQLTSFVNTVTSQLNGAHFYDLTGSGYTLFSQSQRASGSADNALSCWNDNYTTGAGADFNDFAILWTVKASQTATAPTVTTGSVSNVAQTSATAAGNVTSDGGSTILERGIVYSSTNQTPTTSDSKVAVSGTTGTFSGNLTGLTAHVKYFVRAYARNAVGTSYGAMVEFSTLDNTQVPTVTTGTVTNVGQTTATVPGNVTSDGGSTVLERGVVYSSTNTTPTTADNKVAVSGTTGVFSADLTGLTPLVTYYARAYARNAQGTAYGAVIHFATMENMKLPPTVTTSEITSITSSSAIGGGDVTSDGGATITERGIVYSKTNQTPTTADTKVVDATKGTTGTYSINISSLTAHTKYFVRAYATNSKGTSYGAMVEFSTADANKSAPTVVTESPVEDVNVTNAKATGDVTSDGGSTITERGFVYSSTKTSPTLSDSPNRNTSGTLGEYSIVLTGLTARTKYYVRAYAKNAIGTSYGSVVEFTTDMAVPTHTPSDTGFSDNFLLYLGGVLYVMGIGMFVGAKAMNKSAKTQIVS